MMNDRAVKSLLVVENLTKYFPVQKGIFRRVVGHVKAVDGISFHLEEGETLGLVGESGCGKTTAGRCLLRLIEPTRGAVRFRTNGELTELTTARRNELFSIRRDAQMIFQDPVSSLDPRMTVRDVVAEPMDIHRIGSRKERTERVEEALKLVRLSSDMINRYPHEFSGGQRQRIGLARALILGPKLLVCDEPVSALDVSVQAQVLNLLEDLKSEMGLTLLFIAHDLSVVEHISDRVMVMYLGKIVETAASDSLYKKPKHPYTEALLAAVPMPDPRSQHGRLLLEGSVPDPSKKPLGCSFHTRCSYAVDLCREEEPELVSIGSGNADLVACHRASELELAGFRHAEKIQWLEESW